MEKDGKIYIDGKSSSQYIPKQRFYYMEGDNRMNSHDSRSFGFISEEAIIGKFDFVLFSIDSQKQWWKAIRLRRMMMRFSYGLKDLHVGMGGLTIILQELRLEYT